MGNSALHELLAVDNTLSGQAKKTTAELVATFTSKRHLFQEKRVEYHPDAETEKVQVTEHSSIQSTVASEIDWISEKLVKAIDVGHAIDVANTSANADVVLDDALYF